MKSGHPELSTVPWALWGHSGGGHWAGGMTLLHPERTVAAWLRSGVPALTAVEGKPTPYLISAAASHVPIMCNLGTQEGVTVKDGPFAGVWPGVELYFNEMRAKGGLVGLSVDPLSAHECGNQRYLAIPWLDACLSLRLPEKNGAPLKPISEKSSWIAPLYLGEGSVSDPVPTEQFTGVLEKSTWLPTQAIAVAWTHYVKDTAVPDTTAPPAPTNLHVTGNLLTWDAEADLESGLAGFIIERDGQPLVTLPSEGKNRFGRPVFQNLQYSDTPTQPLVKMQFRDETAAAGATHRYQVIAINTVGLKSK